MTEPTVRLYHGTNAAALRSIMNDGCFLPADHHALATEIERRYNLSPGAVWDSPYFTFERGFRAEDRNVYFSGDRQTAQRYATIGSEAVFDALTAVWMAVHQHDIDANDGTYPAHLADGPEPWVREQTALHYSPVVVTVDIPWDVFAAAHPEWDGLNQPSDCEHLVGTYLWYEWAIGGEWESLTTVSLPAPVDASYIIATRQV